MKKPTKKATKKKLPRNSGALPARMRRAGPMRDRRARRPLEQERKETEAEVEGEEGSA
jgi:hypothetical protein